MKRFEEWLEINHPEALDEGWRNVARNVAVGGALLGAGMGLGKAQGADYKSKVIPNSSATVKGAEEFTRAKPGQSISPYSYNSEIGKYIFDNGIYHSAKGNFKRVPSNSGDGFRFVKLPG
jgi:hypothetical protein